MIQSGPYVLEELGTELLRRAGGAEVLVNVEGLDPSVLVGVVKTGALGMRGVPYPPVRALVAFRESFVQLVPERDTCRYQSRGVHGVTSGSAGGENTVPSHVYPGPA